MRFVVLLLMAAVAVAACSRPASDAPKQQPAADSQPTAPSPSSTAAQQHAAIPEAPPIDVCSLLTAEEIADVQGAAVTTMIPDRRVHNGLAIAQCYFTLPVAADSLSLIVYKNPAAGERTPRALWTELFHTERAPKTGRDGKPKTQPTPQKIEGVGDEAFWGGGQFGGTLHVLKGDDVFQLSVGGPGDEAKKLESLKQLATRIAERL